MKLLMILQVLDALVSDVVTVLHAHPVDAGNALVGFFLGFFQRRGNGDNIQHAAAIDDEFTVLLSSACMEYDAVFLLGIFNAADDFAGCMGSRITAGRQDDIDSIAVFPCHFFMCKFSVDAVEHDLCKIAIEKRKSLRCLWRFMQLPTPK